jgi:diguanylate cyclase (GGDEF)-like protein
MTAVLLTEVEEIGGKEMVAELLRLAESPRSVEYLADITNWISYDEAIALWRAGTGVTQNPQLPTLAGKRAARRLSASPVANLLRSLGSPENLYREITTGATKFSTVVRLESIAAGPGLAEIAAVPVDGFPRTADHCAWTMGMLSGATVLFGMPPASVEHDRCAALGAPDCRYRITWSTESAATGVDSEEPVMALRQQLDAMQERLNSMFATASDLIATDDLGDVLARITDRAAVEVRAPRYLLTVRTAPGEPAHCHHKGFDAEEALAAEQRILEDPLESLPESWLVVPVRSRRCDYGRLVAMYPPGQRFFPQERELFEVYARYAASALDSATALMEAKRRAAHSSALLDLARALAAAGTSDEVARRLADAVPIVVDCDRVSVYLWDPREAALRLRRSSDGSGAETGTNPEDWMFTPSPGSPLQQWLDEPSAGPVFVDADSGHPMLRELAARADAVASITVPLATGGSLLGLLVVWVTSGRERLEPTPDLLDRISGVAAQATTALQNGRLVDEMTHQALHDQLTGLTNRMGFSETLHCAIERAGSHQEPLELFYIDLDGFKPVNDEFGHEIGDHLLVAVGERLRGCTRASDTVARLGGDEFAVLIQADGAECVHERLMAALESPFRIGGHELRLGASVGRAVFPVDGEDAETLLRRSDAAMFTEKRARYAMRRGDGAPPLATR